MKNVLSIAVVLLSVVEVFSASAYTEIVGLEN